MSALDFQLEQQVKAFIEGYYHRFDGRAPFESFENDFDWDNFLMSSPERTLTTKQAYQAFYAETAEQFTDSCHQISHFRLTRKTKEGVEASCDVVFTARLNAEPQEPIEVKGRIQFILKRGAAPDSWKICRYLIEASG